MCHSNVNGVALVTQERMEEARQLFRNEDTTEFVIVTIPTVMAAAESGRLAVALRSEGVPVNTIVINQVSTDGCHDLRAREMLDRACIWTPHAMTPYHDLLLSAQLLNVLRWCSRRRVSSSSPHAERTSSEP